MQTPSTLTRKISGQGYKPALVNITYLLSLFLTVGWAIAFFGFHAGNAVHLLLAMAMTTVVVNIVRGA